MAEGRKGGRREALRPLQVQAADPPFLVCTGTPTKAENDHLLQVGLRFEDSQTSEFFDVSTMNESAFLDALENIEDIDTSIVTTEAESTTSGRQQRNSEEGTTNAAFESSAINNGTFEIHEDVEVQVEESNGTFEIEKSNSNETFEINEEDEKVNDETFEIQSTEEKQTENKQKASKVDDDTQEELKLSSCEDHDESISVIPETQQEPLPIPNKLPEIPPVNIEEFSQQPLFIEDEDVEDESIVEDKENMTPRTKQYEDQDTTHFFEEESFVSSAAADKTMNNPLDETTGLQGMFATPSSATKIIASNQKVLRRSLRIALQKQNVGDLTPTPSTAEKPLRGRKSTHNANNTTLSSPMVLFIDSVRTPVTLPRLSEEDNKQPTDTVAATDTPKKQLRSSVARTPRKLNSAMNSVNNTTISSPMALFIDSVQTPAQKPLSSKLPTPSRKSIAATVESTEESVPASIEPSTPIASAKKDKDDAKNETISSPMNLFIESVKTPKARRSVSVASSKIPRKSIEAAAPAETIATPSRPATRSSTRNSIAAAANKSISSPMNLFIDSVRTPIQKKATPRKSLKMASIKESTSPAATTTNESPIKNHSLLETPKKKLSSRTSLANASLLSSPMNLFIDSVKTPIQTKTNSPLPSAAASISKAEETPKTTPLVKSTTPRKSIAVINEPIGSPAKPDVNQTPLETPKKKRTSLAANNNASLLSSPMNLFIDSVKTPLAGNKKSIEMSSSNDSIEESVIPATPIPAAPAPSPAKSATKAAAASRNILPFYSPSVMKALTGSPYFAKRPLPTEVIQNIRNEVRGQTPDPSSSASAAVEKSSPCLINFDASLHVAENNSVLDSTHHHDIFSTSIAATAKDSTSSPSNTNAANVSLDLIKLDESRRMSMSAYGTGCSKNDTTASSSVFDSSQCSQSSSQAYGNAPGDTTTDSAGTHDDTIELMDRLLAMADEQEKNEELQNQNQTADFNFIPESPRVPPSSPQSAEVNTTVTPSKPAAKTPLTRPPSALTSKRVIDLQKKKFFFTPSPTKTQKKTSAAAISANSSRLSIGPPNSPLLKRTKSFIEVKARVDSNVDGKSPAGVVTLGLSSKVADYIYSKAPPTQFQRVTGAAAASPSSAGTSGSAKKRPPFVVGKATGIPRPSLPFLNSKIPPPNVGRPLPKSASRIHPVSTIGAAAGKPAAAAATPSRQFKSVNYTSASKLKTPNEKSFYEKSLTKNYTGIRHTGNRDESGNASIIQNVSLTKAFVGSRLATPKSYTTKKY